MINYMRFFPKMSVGDSENNAKLNSNIFFIMCNIPSEQFTNIFTFNSHTYI